MVNSVTVLKEVEDTRRVTFLKNNMPPTVDDDQHSLVVRRATNLSEDLVDEIEEGLVDQLDKLNQHKTNTRAKCTRPGY